MSMFGEEEFAKFGNSLVEEGLLFAVAKRSGSELGLFLTLQATWKVRYLAKRGDEHARKTALLKSKLMIAIVF